MKPSTRPWYMATPPDGVIEHSRLTGTPIDLAEHVGRVLEHPNPCRKWYDETGFSYFRMVNQAGEALEDTGIWPAIWPIRLWQVEPVGDTGNWAEHLYPYRRLAHQVRVLEEIDPEQALGRRGREVLDLIEQELPERAARWAAEWAADSDGMRERTETWRLCSNNEHASGMYAWIEARHIARAQREEAAMTWAGWLAVAAVDQALTGVNTSPEASNYAWRRARALAAAVQLQDQLRPYVLHALQATELDARAGVTVS